MARSLKFGFSEEVIEENVKILKDMGRSDSDARRLAEQHAKLSKKKLDRARDKRNQRSGSQ